MSSEDKVNPETRDVFGGIVSRWEKNVQLDDVLQIRAHLDAGRVVGPPMAFPEKPAQELLRSGVAGVYAIDGYAGVYTEPKHEKVGEYPAEAIDEKADTIVKASDGWRKNYELSQGFTKGDVIGFTSNAAAFVHGRYVDSVTVPPGTPMFGRDRVPTPSVDFTIERESSAPLPSFSEEKKRESIHTLLNEVLSDVFELPKPEEAKPENPLYAKRILQWDADGIRVIQLSRLPGDKGADKVEDVLRPADIIKLIGLARAEQV